MSERPSLELAAGDPRGVRIAASLGLDRVELCSGLELGGLSPSAGLTELALQEAAAATSPLGVHVLVRPRAGGFDFDADEVATMVAEIRQYVAQGVDGVVIGALRDGALDFDTLARLSDAAGDAHLTLHRAFDFARDQVATLADLAALGERTGHPIRRVLTSGGKDRVGDAIDQLTILARNEFGIAIMAGGGLTPENAAAVRDTGVQALHFSARTARQEAGGVSLGSSGGGDVVWSTDADRAAAFVAALRP